MAYFEKREVGWFDLEFKTNGFYRLSYLGKPFEAHDTQAKLLWYLAKYPNTMVDKVEIYKMLYGNRPPQDRPSQASLVTLITKTRKLLRKVARCNRGTSYLVSDYRGSIGFFSTPQLPLTEGRRGRPADRFVQERIEALRQA